MASCDICISLEECCYFNCLITLKQFKDFDQVPSTVGLLHSNVVLNENSFDSLLVLNTLSPFLVATFVHLSKDLC